MEKVILKVKFWLPVVLWAGFLFYLSSIPNLKASSNPAQDEIIRTAAHFLFYALGYGLFFRALKQPKNFWWPLGLTCLYGFFDEVHQSFVPTRTFQIQDLVVDFSGAYLGQMIIRRWR